MESAKDQIKLLLSSIGERIAGEHVEVVLEIPEDSKNGDYSSNIALRLSKKLGKSPREIAEQIKSEVSSQTMPAGRQELEIVDKVEVAGPGFLNFYLSKEYLLSNLGSILQEKDHYGSSNVLKDARIMVEFAHPNTHKEFHIGHTRNITTGEAISRILASQGADLSRVNYQGDVGMHVAKALYGVKKLLAEKGEDLEKIDKESSSAQAEFLGLAYATGSKLYEENEEAKLEIGKINKKIYAKDPEIMPLWEETREWSLEYFESIYARMGAHFDRLFFESEVYESGKEIVLSHVDDGIFIKDQGAIIFLGEKYGLHNRVFVTSEGNPTYEGKEMGLGPLQYKEFRFDKALHVVGPEQAGYFKVVFKALEAVNPDLVGKEEHIAYGFVQLKEGKMSSRMGNIIKGEWLLDEAKKRILASYPDIPEETAEKIAVGAVKYSMLKVNREADIAFNFDESINLHGNSGPYLQYAYARTQSILGKAQNVNYESRIKNYELEKEEEDLLRVLAQFSEVVARAAAEYAPNFICTYLFEVTQKFSSFYEKHRVINVDDNEIRNFRLALVAGVGQVLKNGLLLLGMQAPEKI